MLKRPRMRQSQKLAFIISLRIIRDIFVLIGCYTKYVVSNILGEVPEGYTTSTGDFVCLFVSLLPEMSLFSYRH